MEIDNTEIVENTQIDETAAADTLRPNPTRAEMMATFSSLMSQLGKEDMTNFLSGALAQVGTSSVTAPGKTGLGQMPAPKFGVKEDVAEMFEGEELSEEFKDKAEIIFEATLNARLVIERAKIEEEFENRLNEETEAVRTNTNEKVDQYLDFVIEQWLNDNQIAIESSIRTEIAEDFIHGLYNLFTESYISVPDDKVDVIEELSARIEDLESKLDESINGQLELQGLIDEANCEATFDEVSEGLAATQVEKLRTLSEGIEFDDVETYKKKLVVIRNKYFAENKITSTNIITEESDNSQEPAPITSTDMGKYAAAISRTVKR